MVILHVVNTLTRTIGEIYFTDNSKSVKSVKSVKYDIEGHRKEGIRKRGQENR